MSRRLWLMRHAKSSWSQKTLADHDRPLKRRGIVAAETMGHFLLGANSLPQYVWISTATRARQTWELIEQVWQAEHRAAPAVRWEVGIYHAEPSELVQRLAETPDEISHALLIGHNPGLEDWMGRLTGMPYTIPTATVVDLELSIDSWSALTQSPVSVQVRHVWRPRQLPESAQD